MSEPTPVSELTFGTLRKTQDRRKEFFESRGTMTAGELTMTNLGMTVEIQSAGDDLGGIGVLTSIEFFRRGPDLVVGVTLESGGWTERYDVPTWRRVVVQ